MKLKIYNFVFETYEDPNDYYIDCDMSVINKDDLSVNPQCEVQLDQEWISIESKMPDEGVEILHYFEVTGVSVGMFERPNIFYGRSGFLTGDVTHWMPLPNPPKF